MNKTTTIKNLSGYFQKHRQAFFAGLCLFFLFSNKAIAQDPYILTVFDQILFYDGYAANVSEPVPDGVIRHSNSLYAKKLTAEQLAQFGNKLTMNVTIKASCDNYDRIGNINLALVPKDATSYNPSEVQRLELGRYITPFMNKNVQPDEVPYTYEIDNVAQIFKDTQLTSEFDLWVELELFGVPYAANTQVAGCSGRNDVFFGTLEFVSETDASVNYSNNFLKPLSFKYEMRDYNLSGTDVLNETVRTINFTLDEALPNAKLYLITSSHGAGSGGEEYVRRQHFVYVDGVQVLTYKPGGVSCGPYRRYNTQGNCIYNNCNTGAPLANTDAAWSWNNWCPGNSIPIREISLGNLSAGAHSFKIDVPDATFNGNDGMIPMSVYLQSYDTVLSTDTFSAESVSLYPNPVLNTAVINAVNQEVKEFTVVSITGQVVSKGTSNNVDMSALKSGMYIVKILFSNDEVVVKKVIKS
ncbi:peptide-N-glycosidase F-related protein [Flavobacterium psychrotrophum]|uniref:peptide-N-glycosidase F-related protein n=1 Tax=Flavobacterium psychrotrophum TaxID=2294119 RepID=UPI000E3106DF|nr:peptide-N-glycosidase F-related protein [Flavobacterium psychrotrophum]